MRVTPTLLLASFAIGLPAATCSAAPPIAFDSWSSTGGKPTAGCPAGFKCDINVSDTGIFQQILVDSKGNRFIQLIVEGADGHGGYASTESYNNASGNGKSGISVKQRVKQTTGVTGLDETSIINTGSANVVGSPSIQINQKVTHIGKPGTTFASTMNLLEQRDANNKTTGTYLDIREDQTGSNIWSTGKAASGTDKYVWVTRKVDGVYVPKAGSVSLPGAAGNMGMGGGGGGGGGMGGGGMAGGSTGDPVGGSMSWAAGNQLQVVWGAINCAGCQQTSTGGGMGGGGGGGMMGVDGSRVSFQSYNNLSDSAAAVYTRALGSNAPINWPSTFGAAPTF